MMTFHVKELDSGVGGGSYRLLQPEQLVLQKLSPSPRHCCSRHSVMLIWEEWAHAPELR